MRILIKNGNIIDGSGKPPYQGDILIENEKIKEISINQPLNAKADKIIDAKNLLVTPGFIDINSESDHWLTIISQPQQESLIAQGITTAIVGNNGSSLSPMFKDSLKSIRKWQSPNINLNWQTTKEFLEFLKQKKLGINVGTLVGHATIKRGILGEEFRDLIDQEIDELLYLIEKSLSEGALGVSFGFRFNHSRQTSFSEIFAIAQLANKYNAYLNLQPRWEKENLLSFANEILNLTSTLKAKNKIRILISYLRPYPQNLDELKQTLGLLKIINEKGLAEIHIDINPYTIITNQLYIYLPKWLLYGSFEIMLENIEKNYNKVVSELKNLNYDFSKMIISSAQNNIKYLNGKSINFLAQERGMPAEKMFLEIFKISHGRITILNDELSWPELLGMMEMPFSIVSTQNPGLNFDQVDFLPHPASFNTFPRFLGLIKTGALDISLIEGIKKITSEPALKIGLKNRGLIQKNYFADLIILDPQKLDYIIDYKNPFRKPSAIKTVLINGEVAYDDEKFFNCSAGQVLTR